MTTDLDIAKRYAPIAHFDQNETIPLVAVGFSVMRESGESPSFRRDIFVPPEAAFVVEYAYYWDYDIQHMYDLEHIWVTVDRDGRAVAAEGSFHGRYLTLLVPELSGAVLPTDEHVHAFCQPGKHAFAADGQFFRLIPDWYGSCNIHAGGEVLVGGPFCGVYEPTARQNALSCKYLRERLAFSPTLQFTKNSDGTEQYMPWANMYEMIPARIFKECARLEKLYEKE